MKHIFTCTDKERSLLIRALDRFLYIGATEGWAPRRDNRPSWTDDFSVKERDLLREILRTLKGQ